MKVISSVRAGCSAPTRPAPVRSFGLSRNTTAQPRQFFCPRSIDMNDQPDIPDPSPPTLDHVIGQKQAIQQLRTALDAYFNDRPTSPDGDSALCHVLLCGPAGVGKSLISQILAKELGSSLHEELAQNLLTPGHLQGLLMLAEAGDVVFVDEIHELPAVAQTTLYRCLEERRLFLGGDRKNVTLPP